MNMEQMAPVGGGRDPETSASHMAVAATAEKELDRWSALDAYDEALVADSENESAAFRMAYHLDLVGEDEEATRLLEGLCSRHPAKINALINLAVLYEDAARYAKAEKCLRLVLDTDPNHGRARLFMKDVQASRLMFRDDESARQRDRQTGLLETPVADFELSVRARNCLKKMGIRTIGDLLRISEAELMDYKNFGETTLVEIKSMLAQNGMRIGQALEQRHSAAREAVYEQLRASGSEEQASLLGRGVDELNLSVRARKALDLLQIQSIGDLVAYTEAELLGIKNFGQTSLDEIKIKLTEQGLSLRDLEGAG